MKLSESVNPHIAALKPYQPGKPIEELERELGVRDPIKLAERRPIQVRVELRVVAH